MRYQIELRREPDNEWIAHPSRIDDISEARKAALLACGLHIASRIRDMESGSLVPVVPRAPNP